MRWLSRLRSKEQDLDDEKAAHLAIEKKQRIEAGETPEEAERSARRRMSVRSNSRASRWRPMLAKVLAVGESHGQGSFGFRMAGADAVFALGDAEREDWSRRRRRG